MREYKEILNYLFSQLPIYQRIGPAAYKTDLTNTIKICKLLGNPHKDFKSIHIAGTNGKGSVAHFIASILQENGLKVGLYTSPHLKDFRERIRINGEMVTKQYVVDFVNNYKIDFEKIQPSFFEMTVGMAFKYFSDKEVDIAVLETGLGGRLDSTNIVDPELSVITNIGYDHMRFLGDTLQSIAKEKAGIIKPRTPVVIGETQDEIRDVFLNKVSETGSDIYFADECFMWERHKAAGRRKQLKIRLGLRENKKLPIRMDVCVPLLGEYQIKNVVTAIGAISVLNTQVYQINIDEVRMGIKNVVENTGIRGRWEVLSENPLTICDMGHNLDGITAVVDQIKKIPYNNLHFVFGMVEDKNAQDILDLVPKDATYYFCKANIPRGMDHVQLAAAATVAGLKGKPCLSVREALEAARENADPDDLIFIGGSTFIVAELL